MNPLLQIPTTTDSTLVVTEKTLSVIELITSGGLGGGLVMGALGILSVFAIYILKEYHPYTDGNSAKRMVDTVEEYIKKNGVPENRLISWFRRYKINKIFRKI